MAERFKKLSELLTRNEPATSVPDGELAISGVTYDSRKVAPGMLFVAVRGFQVDGHEFVKKAQENGAAAAVVERRVAGVEIPQILVPDAREALAKLSYRYYMPEIGRIKLVGITGTNGKTTSALLMQSVIEATDARCGLIGTIAYEYGQKKINAWNTTPEAPDICRMLFEMAEQGYEYCALEVSSHGLALKRVEGLTFRTALFTNLSRDHMDFHDSEEDYFLAKAHLFDLLAENGRAVVNIDDHFGRKLQDRIKQPVVTFGLTAEAQVSAPRWETRIDGLEIEVATSQGRIDLHASLTGFFNIYNILGVVGAALALDLDLAAVKKGIERVQNIPGRLEMIPVNNDARVFIDYAHTPDALQKVLQTLRSVTPGRLLVLFGAGGDRDKGKRPLMGKIAAELADWAYVTSDNPRTEDPEAIIEDIIRGMQDLTNWQKITDRREAIRTAVRALQPGDVLLIAGKGHETYQEIDGVKHPFDERAMVLEALNHA